MGSVGDFQRVDPHVKNLRIPANFGEKNIFRHIINQNNIPAVGGSPPKQNEASAKQDISALTDQKQCLPVIYLTLL